MAADLWATGVTPDGHPLQLVRPYLDTLGVVTAEGLRSVEHGTRVRVGGVVTHRQRPATAGGTTFVNLEDETGLINVICSKGLWERYRRIARGAPALLIRGIIERTASPTSDVINLVADRIDPLPMRVSPGPSRDFH